MLLSYRALWPILLLCRIFIGGYGFPIGGVAATSLDNGVISPGGVGFDINCLSPDALILHPFGYTLEIRKFEKLWAKEEINCFDFKKFRLAGTLKNRFLTEIFVPSVQLTAS